MYTCISNTDYCSCVCIYLFSIKFYVFFQEFILSILISEKLEDVVIDVTDGIYMQKLGEKFNFEISVKGDVNVCKFCICASQCILNCHIHLGYIIFVYVIQEVFLMYLHMFAVTNSRK